MTVKYLLQSGDFLTDEKRIIQFSDCMYAYTSIDKITVDHKDCIPVGSVEFVKEFARVTNIKLPKFETYPTELRRFIKRTVHIVPYKDADSYNFIKPVSTKMFAGGIKKSITENILPEELCYESDPITLIAEWRCYILNRQVVGISRYDDNDTEYDLDIEFVNKMVNEYNSQPIGYSLDIGKLDNGELLLVEANDGYSLGYYKWGTMKQDTYLTLITKRWQEIIK